MYIFMPEGKNLLGEKILKATVHNLSVRGGYRPRKQRMEAYAVGVTAYE